jgi:hypothetical protein
MAVLYVLYNRKRTGSLPPPKKTNEKRGGLEEKKKKERRSPSIGSIRSVEQSFLFFKMKIDC